MVPNNEITIDNLKENENEKLLEEYETQLNIAVSNYKKASAKQEFAFDSYDEECIKEEMALFRDEVKSLRVKIDKLNNELNTDVV